MPPPPPASSLGRRLAAGPRSLRVKLLVLGVAVSLLPLGLLGVAWSYERVVIADELERLRAAAVEAQVASADQLAALGTRLRVEIARFDAAGRVVVRSQTMAAALDRSALGRVGEMIVGGEPPETLAAADAELGPWPDRPEVKAALAGVRASSARLSRSAETLVIAVAEPATSGGALYLLAGSHRGVRRLVVARRQLVQLAVYEIVLVLPLLLFYGLRVVRPISRLADAARRYPAAPLADPALLRRGDEIATLAHTLSAMASDLEGRRRQAAELGADIAHEFKNPLASIAASAELLASTKALTADRVALISGTVTTSVERMRRSIDELLALLRLEQAVPDEAREPTPYAAFLEEVLADYRRDPRWAGWTFTLAVSAAEAPALEEAPPRLNRRRFAELLRNLIDNALVQPAARREIVVGARRVGAEIVTSVRDFGPGIATENRERVFQRFFSARPASAPPGSGLGLSVAQAIAHAHGGRVELGPIRSHGEPGAELLVIVPV